MTPRDWLLLYIAFKGAPQGLDPVKIQKGMFLFAMESDVTSAEKYSFEPYNYGPMSKAVYRDLDVLAHEGLIERIPVTGYSWHRYRTTPAGIHRATEIRDRANRVAARKLFEIKSDLADQSFDSLLSDVYARYPRFAVASVFRPS